MCLQRSPGQKEAQMPTNDREEPENDAEPVANESMASDAIGC